MNKALKLAIMGAAAVALASTDNLIKNKIDTGKIEDGNLDKKGFFEIEKHHNKGLPMNKLDNHTKEITAVSALVLGVHAANTVNHAINSDDHIVEMANTLILAGAMSNTYDRVYKGYVTDYLKIGRKKKAIYNISDFFIIGGVLLTLVGTLKDVFSENT